MSSISILGDTSGSVLIQAPAVAGSSTLTLPTTGGTVFAGSTSTVQQATSSVATTGSNTANTWTDISGVTLSLVPGTYLLSYYATLESSGISGSSGVVQGCIPTLAVRTSANTVIDAITGNYTNNANTYNIEALSKSIVYTVSATTTYKLSFTYTQNSGSPTLTGFSARGELNGNPVTFNAIKLY